ncbi:MAG: class D sortase [Holophagae bacterium]|jgi:sortase A
MADKERVLRVVQWLLIAAGVVLVGIWIGFRMHASAGRDADLQRFAEAREAAHSTASSPAPTPEQRLPADLPVDTTLWAEGRIEEYQASLDADVDPPLAILRIPVLELEVAVLEGTSELALNRGLGHISGTPLPGADGNVGIAGHRDGYFRGLKDIAIGDVIELETLDGLLRYVITETIIVDPSDVWVLAPTERPTLTLVTCYPFYFVGSAPERFIVHAELVNRGP